MKYLKLSSLWWPFARINLHSIGSLSKTEDSSKVCLCPLTGVDSFLVRFREFPADLSSCNIVVTSSMTLSSIRRFISMSSQPELPLSSMNFCVDAVISFILNFKVAKSRKHSWPRLMPSVMILLMSVSLEFVIETINLLQTPQDVDYWTSRLSANWSSLMSVELEISMLSKNFSAKLHCERTKIAKIGI